MTITAHQARTISSERVHAIDILRGFVMVIMALDHVREFWGPTPTFPEDLTQTTVPLFLTRWITHICAPTFIFLSGISIFLYQSRKGPQATSMFTFTRGLWLIVIEIVVMTFIVTHSFNFILLAVFWVIGCCMILMAALIWLPRAVSVALCVIMIAGHNLWPSINPTGGWEYLIAIVHNTPFFMASPPALVTYTIIPWVGVMLAGYVIGPWFMRAADERNRLLQTAGLCLLGLFILLRLLNVYGDPVPYSVQERGWEFTVLSFVNVTKYPPSLQFLCLTIGAALILLTLFRNPGSRANSILAVYGQVPFFFFVLHFALISLASYVWTAIDFGQGINLAFTQADARPAEYVPSLARVYLVWVIVLVVTYFPCKWFSEYKKRNRQWWLSYL